MKLYVCMYVRVYIVIKGNGPLMFDVVVIYLILSVSLSSSLSLSLSLLENPSSLCCFINICWSYNVHL